MATLYHVGTGNWNSATWATTSGGAATNTPTAADDCVFDANSGNCTINSGSVCRSWTVNGYTGTITHTSAVTLSVGDGTAGAGNVAINFATSGWTYTLGSAVTSGVSLVSTSGTQQTVLTNGKNFGPFAINGAGSSYLLSDAIGSTNGVFALQNGTLATGDQTINVNQFTISGSGTRTLTPGSSSIVVGSGGFSGATTTNLTVSSNTAVVSNSSGNVTFALGSFNWNGMSISATGSATTTVTGSGWTVANFTRSGTATKTDALTFAGGGSGTISGTFTVNANSDINRVVVQSSVNGTSFTINAATVVLTNTVTFQDITGAGAATWTVAGTGATYIGDAGGNSGITATTPATQTATGTASFTWSTHGWTSRVPLPQDDVVVNNAFVAGRTVTMDMPRAGKNIDFSGSTGAPTLNTTVSNEITGSLTLAANNILSGTSGFTLSGRGSHTITSAGVTHTGNFILNCAGGTYTLADAFTTNRSSTSAFTITSGTLDNATNNVSVTLTGAASGVQQAGGVLNMGNATWSMGATNGTFWNNTGGTVNCGTSTITLTNTTSSNRTFIGNNQTYHTLTYTLSGSTGALALGGGFTLDTFNFSDASNARTCTVNSHNTIRNFNVNGSASGNMTFASVSGGSTRYPSIGAGTTQQTVDRVTFQDIWVQEPYKLFATNSTDTSNNRNITFGSTPPSAPYIRQAKGLSSSSTSHSLTFSYATTSGNLLLIALGARAAPGTLTPPTGFSVAKDNANTANSTIWYKVADGTETTLTTTSANSLTNPDYYIYEVAGFSGTPTLDVTAESDNASSASQPVGTVSNTQSPAFAIGVASGNGSIGSYTTVPTNSWQQHYYATGGTPSSSGVAAIPLTATASQTTDIHFTSARTGAGAMAIFYGVVSSSFKPKVIFM